jgi:hypothetical protein
MDNLVPFNVVGGEVGGAKDDYKNLLLEQQAGGKTKVEAIAIASLDASNLAKERTGLSFSSARITRVWVGRGGPRKVTTTACCSSSRQSTRRRLRRSPP